MLEGLVIENGQMSIVGRDLTTIPPEVGQKFGDRVKQLDLNFNQIQTLQNLEQFHCLETLICDNNELEGHQDISPCPSLTTLWVNNNNIDDLAAFMKNIKQNFPNLTYLSLLKNPCCPSNLDGNEEEDYQRYRYYVLCQLDKLKFLDAKPVSSQERAQALRIGRSVVRTSQVQPPPEEPQPRRKAKKGEPRAFLRIAKYEYQGKESEGNRFIFNHDL